MALISCSECGNQISSNAIACPHCGNPMQLANQSHIESPPLPKKQTNPYLLYTLPIVAGSFLMGIVYAAPFLKAYQIEKDLEAKNSARLVKSIDFPKLQTNLKSNFNALMQKDLQNELAENPFGEVGAVFAKTLIDNIVDSYITPEGLSNLLKNTAQEITGFDIVNLGYTSFNEFSIKVVNADKETANFTLSRQGFGWKLTNIILPETVFSDIQDSQFSDEYFEEDYGEFEDSISSMEEAFGNDTFETPSGDFTQPLLTYKNSCGDVSSGTVIWYRVIGDAPILREIKNNYCADAFLRGDNTVQVASFTSEYDARYFIDQLSQETGFNFWIQEARISQE